MTMRHVIDQLPLWIEGDLDPRERQVVEAHLAGCAECRAEAEAFRESQAWLKDEETPAFNADEREALRAGVLARLRAKPSTRPMWLGVAALAAAALLIVLARPHPSPAVAARPPAPEKPIEPAPAIPAPERPVRLARHRPIHPPLDSDAGPGASRIEIQTDNPQIRIIWLARATTTHGAPEGSPDPI